MDIGELLESVRDYPLLESMVLEAMTDEEWEQYLDTLLSDNASDEGATKDQGTKPSSSWNRRRELATAL